MYIMMGRAFIKLVLSMNFKKKKHAAEDAAEHCTTVVREGAFPAVSDPAPMEGSHILRENVKKLQHSHMRLLVSSHVLKEALG